MASRGFQVSVTRAKSYVAANQLRSGSRKRTERCIAKVRHLYRDLDTDCETRLTSLRASAALLTPTAVISTSPGKYRVRCRIDCSPFARQESTLKLLCIAFGRDPVSTNVSEYPSDSTSNPDDFRLDIAAANAILLSCSIPWQKHSRKHAGKHTNSDHDWAGPRHDLAHGKDARKVCQRWLRVAPDLPRLSFTTPSGQSMSQSAKVWLIEGIPMDDSVTLLEVRRRFEIPTALCSAPGREVALTAQKVIARRKTV
jgi:RepB DNA-primase N-terminal domain